MKTPDWQSDDGRIQLHCCDALSLLPQLEAGSVDAIVTDPPYGIAYSSGKTGQDGGTALPGIVGDDDTGLRDTVLSWWKPRPAIVFGTWKRQRPIGCKAVLTWEKGDHVGMGDLSLPWKPNTEEIYILGKGFRGHRGTSVLRHKAPVSWNSTTGGRTHPHEKPVSLMVELIEKCEGQSILDPFAGSFATAIACIRTGRRFIGCEVERKYFDIGVERCKAELAKHPLLEAV